MNSPSGIIRGIGRRILRVFRPIMSDHCYIKRYFYLKTGYSLSLDSPRTFNEKLQWLKFNDRNPRYIEMVDKFAVKKFVASIIGEKYVVPTIAVFDNPDDIDYEELPDQFVLKCTHDSGGIVICRDKASLDKDAARKKLKAGWSRNYYRFSMEFPYKDVKPRIIAEEFLTNEGTDLCDYKVHCFNGAPKLVLVCKDRYSKSGLTEDFFTEDWVHLDVKRPTHPNSKETIPKPAKLDVMLSLSRQLSEGIPFVRVDWYISNDRLYFGELTFFPASGMTPFVPTSFDDLFGSWIELPKVK